MSATTARTGSNGKRRWGKLGKIDGIFLLIVLMLLVFGLIMLFSSSYVYAYYNEKGDSFHFIKRQAIFAIIGLVVMFVASYFDYHIFRKLAPWVTLAAIVLLVITVIMRFTIYKGAITRWIRIGSIQFQPSEIAKFAVIIMFAHIACANQKKIKTFQYGVVPFVAVLIAIIGPMMLETHVSGTILVCCIGASLMIIGGTDIKYFVMVAAVAAVGLMVIILGGWIGYALERLQYWLDPFSAPLKEGYQVIQSMYAIASGGLIGQGIGESRQKFLYLPEPQNDFIFAIVCEELGFVGAVVVILLFVCFVWRGFAIALRAKDLYGTLVAAGITIQFGLQALLNMMVVTNTIPNTGISLPFFSYGGTALLMLLGEMGVMLNISRSAAVEKAE